eukprot:693256-Prorocentrum_minimum.AAC.48
MEVEGVEMKEWNTKWKGAFSLLATSCKVRVSRRAWLFASLLAVLRDQPVEGLAHGLDVAVETLARAVQAVEAGPERQNQLTLDPARVAHHVLGEDLRVATVVKHAGVVAEGAAPDFEEIGPSVLLALQEIDESH